MGGGGGSWMMDKGGRIEVRWAAGGEIGVHGFTSLRSTPAHVSARQRDLPSRDFVSMPLRPVCQPGLATTPKPTGGHGVARGPDLVDGSALRLRGQVSWCLGHREGCCRGRGPAGC